MKKQIIVSMVGVALLGGSAVSYAQVAPAPTLVPPSPIVAPAPAPIMTPAPVNAKEEKAKKLQEAIGKMENSIQVRITNLDDFAVRIKSRIEKMQLEGKDMTAASAKLAEAQKTIAAAKADLVTLKKRVATMVTAKNKQTEFATVKRSATLGVVAKIKAAHKSLVDVIVIMKKQEASVTVPPATAPGTSTAQ